jgi:hypothetical protein
MKSEFSWQIFEKYSNIKFRENPSSGSRVVPCGQTDGHDEANSRTYLKAQSNGPYTCHSETEYNAENVRRSLRNQFTNRITYNCHLQFSVKQKRAGQYFERSKMLSPTAFTIRALTIWNH